MATEPGDKERVKAWFGSHAGDYAKLYERPTAELGRLLEALAPRPEWRVLDVAAGPGRVTAAVAPHVREVIGVDITPEMEAEFSRKIAASGIVNASFEIGDAERLPFEDGAFDAATCARAAHHFRDVAQAVGEIARVLCPGGVLALSDMTTADTPAAATFLNRMERARDRSHVRALPPAEWTALLQECGFDVERSEVLTEALPFARWLAPAASDGPEASAALALLQDAEPGSARSAFESTSEGWVHHKRRIILRAIRRPVIAGRTRTMDSVTHAFLSDHAERLRGLYMDRIERAVAPLGEADIWWRPHEGATSVGQLLRHLEGNIRQWLCSGLGGAPDQRARAAEFESEARPEKAALLAALRETAAEAARVVEGIGEGIDEATLLAPRRIQGMETTGYHAVAHVLEHLSWHAGQIVWIAKARIGTSHGIAFYDDAALNAARNDP